MSGDIARRVLSRLPRAAQRALLGWAIRRSDWWERTADVLIGVYHGGQTPKYLYPWGLHHAFLARVGPDMRVLDIGCGDGHLARLMAERGARVTAYDRDAAAIERARRHPGQPDIRYFVGEAAADLPAERFDAVVLGSVLSFVEDHGRFLERLHGVTGCLLIRETRADRSMHRLLGRELGAIRARFPEFTKSELVALLERHGWRVVEAQDSFDMFLVASDAPAVGDESSGAAAVSRRSG